MRNIKLIAIALMLGLTAIVYAAGSQQTPPQANGKEKAASCCSNCGDSCCMTKADCGKPGAECCKAGAECCKAGESCCGQNHMSADKQGKAQACDMKDGKGCCGDSCACCKDGACG